MVPVDHESVADSSHGNGRRFGRFLEASLARICLELLRGFVLSGFPWSSAEFRRSRRNNRFPFRVDRRRIGPDRFPGITILLETVWNVLKIEYLRSFDCFQIFPMQGGGNWSAGKSPRAV